MCLSRWTGRNQRGVLAQVQHQSAGRLERELLLLPKQRRDCRRSVCLQRRAGERHRHQRVPTLVPERVHYDQQCLRAVCDGDSARSTTQSMRLSHRILLQPMGLLRSEGGPSTPVLVRILPKPHRLFALWKELRDLPECLSLSQLCRSSFSHFGRRVCFRQFEGLREWSGRRRRIV